MYVCSWILLPSACELRSSNGKQPLATKPFGIFAYSSTLLYDNLSQNNCMCLWVLWILQTPWLRNGLHFSMKHRKQCFTVSCTQTVTCKGHCTALFENTWKMFMLKAFINYLFCDMMHSSPVIHLDFACCNFQYFCTLFGTGSYSGSFCCS